MTWWNSVNCENLMTVDGRQKILKAEERCAIGRADRRQKFLKAIMILERYSLFHHLQFSKTKLVRESLQAQKPFSYYVWPNVNVET